MKGYLKYVPTVLAVLVAVARTVGVSIPGCR